MHFLGKLLAVNINQGPSRVLSTRLACLPGHCATVSMPSGTRERAPGHRAPQCQPDPPHQGFPGGGTPVVRDTLNLPLHLPWVSMSQLRGSPLSKGYMLLLPGRVRRLGPPSNSAPAAGSHPRILCCEHTFKFPMVMLPGELLFDVLRTRISCISDYQNIGSYQSGGGCWSITS